MSTLYPPNEVPEWASDQTNNTPPMSAQKKSGWTVEQKAASAYDNWWKYLAYTWILFVQSLFDSLANMILPGNFTAGGASFTFTDFTYTASASTDQLTKTAHGLHTGLGPVRTTNSGGGLPGGLAPATDYYVIKIDNDNWKMATTRANAIAGVAIDITSAGTGTQTLNCQAGTTRIADVTATRNLVANGNASIAGAATVGGLITASGGIGAFTATGLITASAGLTAGTDQNITVSGTGKIVHGTRTLLINIVSPTQGAGNIVVQSGITSNLLVPLPLMVGWRLTLLRARIKDSATGPTKLAVELWTADATAQDASSFTTLNTGSPSSGAGTSQVITSTAMAVDIVSTTRYSCNIRVTTGSAGCTVFLLEADYVQL